MCFAPQRRALFQDLNFQKWPKPLVFLTFWLPNVLRATTACTFSTSQLPKVVRHWGVLYILTSKCASRHNGVHFFDISTAKSGPELVCFAFLTWNVLRATTACTFSTSQVPKVVCTPSVFVHFDFEMCFAPQRRALFPHLNFQKCSEHQVFCTILLGKCLGPQTACNFSSLLSPTNSWSDSLHLPGNGFPWFSAPLNPPRWGHDFSKLAFSSKGIQQSSAIPIISLPIFATQTVKAAKSCSPSKRSKSITKINEYIKEKSPNLKGELEPKWIYNLDG